MESSVPKGVRSKLQRSVTESYEQLKRFHVPLSAQSFSAFALSNADTEDQRHSVLQGLDQYY